MTSELEIGGRIRKLCFTKFGFTKYLETTKKDPLVNGQSDSQFKRYVDEIWAGLMCQYFIDGIEPDFTKADVDKWLMSVEISDLRKVMEAATEAITGKPVEAGESLALQSVGTN